MIDFLYAESCRGMWCFTPRLFTIMIFTPQESNYLKHVIACVNFEIPEKVQ